MRVLPSLFMLLLLGTSCGPWQMLFGEKEKSRERQIASVAAETLLVSDQESFAEELEDTLNSLHFYYMIAYRHLEKFDEAIPGSSLKDLYQSPSYLSLLASQSQIDEMETDLVELHQYLKENDRSRLKIFIQTLESFSEKSRIHKTSLIRVRRTLGLSAERIEPSLSELHKENEVLVKSKSYQIFEKNIEHLSTLMDFDIESDGQKWRPSETSEGQLSGEEFPSKVWSITFHSLYDASTLLKVLEARQLQGTFFLQADKARKNLKIVEEIVHEGHELGSHSYSGKDLSRVGTLTLEKEISAAATLLSVSQKHPIQFMRLPYASGIKVQMVRRMMARNGLIHILWNVDALDWMAQSPDRIVKRTKLLMKKTSHDSGVVVFHGSHPGSVEASSVILDFLKSDARRTCSLGKIIQDMNEGVSEVCSKNSF